jgi:hypothetical protein
MILDSLSAGHCFIGNDLPAPTRGFHFSVQWKDGVACMGDEIPSAGAVTLQAKLPSRAEIRLIKNGKMIKTTHSETLVYITDEPGVYRIEAYKHYLGKLRGWIFSNPVYIK